MHRLTVSSAAIALLFTGLALAPTAGAAGCEVLQGARDRAECVAHQTARDQARAEVERQLDAGPGGAAKPTSTHSADWQHAIDQANDFDLGSIIEVRPIAAVVGITWFLLAVRSRRRARVRAKRS